jgi:hypothetical protein
MTEGTQVWRVNGGERGMETSTNREMPAEDPLREELVITQEVIQGLLEMLGAAWEEADHMRTAGGDLAQPR